MAVKDEEEPADGARKPRVAAGPEGVLRSAQILCAGLYGEALGCKRCVFKRGRPIGALMQIDEDAAGRDASGPIGVAPVGPSLVEAESFHLAQAGIQTG